MTTADNGVFFNPFEPGFFEDPYEQYRRLRVQGGVHRTWFGPWMLLAHDTCFDLLRRSGTSVQADNAQGLAMLDPAILELAERRGERGRHGILNLDPPDHTRLRRIVSKAFTPRTVERLRERVTSLVDEYLDDVERLAADGDAGDTGDTGDPDGTVDLVATFAFPLPFQVITEMLGMPEGNRIGLRGWSHLVTRFLEPFTTIDQFRESVDASDHMTAHVLDAIEWKRANPADDLLTALLVAEDDGDVLSIDELRDQISLLYVAGHETTVNLIANGTLALLRNRAQLEMLGADPALDAHAVDELLRYDSPVQLSRRVLLEPVVLDGQELGAGELAITCLGAANHDPTRFGADADALDLRRADAGDHLSFGSGIHHCLGAALARLEGSIAIPRLVRRFPQLELATDTPDWNRRVVLRGLDTLRVAGIR